MWIQLLIAVLYATFRGHSRVVSFVLELLAIAASYHSPYNNVRVNESVPRVKAWKPIPPIDDVTVRAPEQQLMYYLLDRYDKDVRPIRKSSNAIVVKLGLTLTQIVNVDEKKQIVTLNVWLDQEWHDQLLMWDPAEFHNIESIRLPAEYLWLPDIVLYNSDTAQSSDVLAQTLFAYYALLSVVGILGNGVSFAVFTCSPLRRLGVSPYLSVLAASDLVQNLTLAASLLRSVSDIAALKTNLGCKLLVYATYVSIFLSTWCITLFTIERAVVVFCPFLRRTYCTNGKAWRCVILLSCGSVVFNVWAPYITEINSYRRCDIPPRFYEIACGLELAETFVGYFIPMLVTCILSAAIARRLQRNEDVKFRIAYSDIKLKTVPLQRSMSVVTDGPKWRSYRTSEHRRQSTPNNASLLSTSSPGNVRSSNDGKQRRTISTSLNEFTVVPRPVKTRCYSTAERVIKRTRQSKLLVVDPHKPLVTKQRLKSNATLLHKARRIETTAASNSIMQRISMGRRTTYTLFAVAMVHAGLNTPSYVTRTLGHIDTCYAIQNPIG